MEKIFSEEHKKNISKSAKGRHKSEEHKRNISKSGKGKNQKYSNAIILEAISLKINGKTQKQISDMMSIPTATIQYWIKNSLQY